MKNWLQLYNWWWGGGGGGVGPIKAKVDYAKILLTIVFLSCLFRSRNEIDESLVKLNDTSTSP